MPIEPVLIGWGGYSTLSTVLALADCLLQQWPGPTQSDAYVTALMVCDAVLSGSEDDLPEDARAAFIEAANEAGSSLMEDDDGPDF
ncbi:DUF982 domain-containing protein [Rhizobium leguminosarum]|nr:DUF982 domain-containing protein [Rhizobium leguminosarum]